MGRIVGTGSWVVLLASSQYVDEGRVVWKDRSAQSELP